MHARAELAGAQTTHAASQLERTAARRTPRHASRPRSASHVFASHAILKTRVRTDLGLVALWLWLVVGWFSITSKHIQQNPFY